jgi:hypothetical protein
MLNCIRSDLREPKSSLMLQTQRDRLSALQINWIIPDEIEFIPSSKWARTQGKGHLEDVACRVRGGCAGVGAGYGWECRCRWKCSLRVGRGRIRRRQRQGGLSTCVYEISDVDCCAVQVPFTDEQALENKYVGLNWDLYRNKRAIYLHSQRRFE